MKNNIKRITYILALFIQITLLLSVTVLNYLTDKKAGVMHHVYYKRAQYEQGILSSSNLNIHSNLSIIVGFAFLIALFIAIKKSRSKFYIIQSLLGVLIGFILPFTIKSSFFIGLAAYTYFIITFEVVLIAQVLILITTGFLDNKSK
jgi:hypothetical protein